jgi:hypothetical protein
MSATAVFNVWILLQSLGTAMDGTAFEQIRRSAEPMSGLSSFLEKYVGECNNALGPNCRSRSADFRSKTNGRRYYLVINEEAVNMLSPGRYNASRDDFEIRITPFFGAGSYAVTQGAPTRVDAQGNPLMPLIVAHAKLSNRWTPERFARMFSSQELRVEVVFTPKATWTLPRKGGGKIYGVNARVEAIKVVVSRSGEELAIWGAK